MWRLLVIVAVMLFSLYPVTQSAEAGVDIGLSIGEEGLRGFYLAVGDYFRVPQHDVIIIRERHIPDEEIPVVLFLAKKAHVAPATIIDLKLRGKTWMDITLHFGLSPEIFYVPVKAVVVGPPYGKAYGYYKNKPKKEWKKIVLSDDDVVNLVNLKFISEYHRYSPEKVIKMREEGRKFPVINEGVKKAKKEKKEDKYDYKKGKGEKEKHQGKGKNKD